MTWTDVIIILGAGQGIFISLLLLIKTKGNRVANRLLAGALISLSAFMVDSLLIRINPDGFPHLIGLTFPVIFVLGPLIYGYVSALTRDTKFKMSSLLHLSPAFLVLCYLMPFYLQPADKKLIFLEAARDQGLPIDLTLIWILSCLQLGIYSVLSMVRLKAYHKSLLDHFSEISKITLKWLQVLVMLNAITWVLYTVIFGVHRMGWQVDPLGISDVVFNLMLTLVIYGIAYIVVTKPRIFSHYLPDLTSTEPKYSKSGLKKSESQQLLEQLKTLMKEHRPYLEPDLTLSELADQLQANPKHVSQMLNQSMHQNFYDFINSYRVAEAKKILQKNKQATILGVAYDSGFGSKSTFNEAFKKITKTTPSKYRQSHPDI